MLTERERYAVQEVVKFALDRLEEIHRLNAADREALRSALNKLQRGIV